MARTNWSRKEVELIVDDYLDMLALEMAGMPYSKAVHRRALLSKLNDRSETSIEFKHCNISAVLEDNGFRPIHGYKRRANYQQLIEEVLLERLLGRAELIPLANADAEHPIVVPEVEDILGILRARPKRERAPEWVLDRARVFSPLPINYFARESQNRSLGLSGELLVLNYERARLIHAGKEQLAQRIEHTSKVRGDHEGFDILSYEVDGPERLIEVKTTQCGATSPFFATRNEVDVSEREAARYHIYRLYDFRQKPSLFTLSGSFGETCELSPSTYLARVK
ncbi:MAG: DUF3883 domain-containing protein [Planctomycetota bacterium]|jgi:hypothetical protein